MPKRNDAFPAGQSDPFYRKHFLAYAKRMRHGKALTNAAWQMYLEAPARYNELGWPTLFRDAEGSNVKKNPRDKSSPKSRRVVIKGDKFKVARFMADNGIPFIFESEAGANTVGQVPNQHLEKLGEVLGQHPEYEGRYAEFDVISKGAKPMPRIARKRNPDATNLAHFEKWNRGGRHKWITKAIAAKLPRIGTHANTPAEKIPVALKLFNPGGAGSWFITEANLDTGEAFGYADLGHGEGELGYMDLNEMRAFKGRFGLPLERDEHFSATLAEVMEGKKNPRKRKKNPGSQAFVIALYMGTANKRLTYDANRNRFTDNSKPSLYATQIAAKNRAEILLQNNKMLTAYRVTVEPATAAERGGVYGARPRRSNPRRKK